MTDTVAIQPGALVVDAYGRRGIVWKEDEQPEEWWLDAQNDQGLRECADDQWWLVFPLSGGAAATPESRTKVLRLANEADVRECFRNANPFGEDDLRKLFPVYCPEPRRGAPGG
jgi:hypothetical protein